MGFLESFLVCMAVMDTSSSVTAAGRRGVRLNKRFCDDGELSRKEFMVLNRDHRRKQWVLESSQQENIRVQVESAL